MKQRFAWAMALALSTASCAGPSGKDAVVRSYDLGARTPGPQLPPLRSVAVRAALPYEGNDMLYRLAWRDTGEIAAFGQSRWAAPPAEMMRRQLVRAMAAANAAACALEIELHEFSQVFASREASEARIELRATLGAPGGRVASRGVSVSEAGAGAGAAGGAAAFARASERVVSELAAWIAAQPACS